MGKSTPDIFNYSHIVSGFRFSSQAALNTSQMVMDEAGNEPASKFDPTGPPPHSVSASNGTWVVGSYLVFSNDWAAFTNHSLHDSD